MLDPCFQLRRCDTVTRIQGKTMTRPKSERRSNVRFDENAQVAVTVLSSDEAPALADKAFFCPTENLSMTGLRLMLHVNVPVDTSMQLRIAFIKPLRAFHHEGRSVWIRKLDSSSLPYACGVEFTRIPPDIADSWRAMIERKLSLQNG